MKVEKLAAIGEIVSSIAIVATLAYLAIHPREQIPFAVARPE
jgi:hypothetical protein